MRNLFRRKPTTEQHPPQSNTPPSQQSGYATFVRLRKYRFGLTKSYRKLEKALTRGLVSKSRLAEVIWAGITTLRKHGPIVLVVRSYHWLRGQRRFYHVSAFQAQVTQLEPTPRALLALTREAHHWLVRPTLTIVTLVRDPSPLLTQEMVSSVLAQTYGAWTWYIGCTHDGEAVLRQLASKDERIRLVSVTDDVFPTTMNMLLKHTDGEYVVFLDEGDTLASWALHTVAEAILKQPTVDFLYSDFDHIDSDGMRDRPCFKPDWSPEAMLGYNLLDHLSVVKRTWLARLDYLSTEAADAAWLDFCLRLGEQTMAIQHIPQILYHARERQPHTEQDTWRQQQADVLEVHLRRLGLTNPSVQFSATLPPEREHPLVKWTHQSHRVSIIIPTRNHAEVLRVCMDSLLTLTTYTNYEVILVDNGSTEAATLHLYAQYALDPRIKIVAYLEPFNFGKACNLGAAQATGDVLLFLNNDTQILHGDWLDLMVQWFDIDEVGIVGPKLLYPDGRIQHAGVILGLGFLAGHLFVGMEEFTPTLFGTDGWYRNLLAVTGACVMIRRTAFEKVGGFDQDYQLLYSDIELCLQIHRAGYRVVYTPHVRLVHYESQTHKRVFPRDDFDHALRDWSAQLQQGDPYFNSHFTYASADPRIKRDTDETCYGHSLYLAKRMPAMPTVSDDDLVYLK